MKCCNHLLAVDTAVVACREFSWSRRTQMEIRQSIVVFFLPCLVTFWDSIPMCSFLFLNIFHDLFLLFVWEGEKSMDGCGCTATACSYIAT